MPFFFPDVSWEEQEKHWKSHRDTGKIGMLQDSEPKKIGHKTNTFQRCTIRSCCNGVLDLALRVDFSRVDFVLLMCICSRCSVGKSCLILCNPRDYSTRVLCPWEFPGKSTGVVCRFLLQGIFLTYGSNPHLYLLQ